MCIMILCYLILSAQFFIVSTQNGIAKDLKQITSDDALVLLLQEIMLKTLDPYKCVVIIRDHLNSDTFGLHWFRRFSTAISFILINVDEYDDLISPKPEIQDSLLLAKREGCQLYIILITNGIQVARLLKFGDSTFSANKTGGRMKHSTRKLCTVSNWDSSRKAHPIFKNLSTERYRALDTMSKYILLFDVRLLDKKLFYLWRRIINVIFIKKYSGKVPPGKDISWFEIMTVPFPVPITSVLIPWRVDIWARSKFRKGAQLFRDKTSDLQNQILRVVIFSHLPGVIKANTSSNTVRALLGKNGSDNTIKFQGIEVEILNTISTAMNFKCEIYEPENSDSELWGRKLDGGGYTGVIGEMVSARADVALGDLYYTSYILDLMDLSVPYNTECLTFLTPEALTDNSWKTLILPFTPIMWASVLISLAFCILSFHYLARFHIHITEIKNRSKTAKPVILSNKMNRRKEVLTLSLFPALNNLDPDMKFTQMKEKYQKPKAEGNPEGLYQFSEPVNSALYTYGMLLLVSIPKLPTGWSLRMLTGWHWLYCLLVVTSYRASMTAILAKPAPKVKIDTLQELVSSQLTCGGWGEMNSEFFKSSDDPLVTTISQNFVLVNDSEEAVNKVAEDSFAFYENMYFLKDAMVKRQQKFHSYAQERSLGNNSQQEFSNNYKGDRRLHIMKECMINMPISIGLQKNSPIKPRVDKYIRRVLEAGFIKKWLDDVMQKVLNTEIQIDDVGNSKALMNMKKFSGALVALLIGYIMSIITLIVEISYFNYVIIPNPKFNKYSRKIN